MSTLTGAPSPGRCLSGIRALPAQQCRPDTVVLHLCVSYELCVLYKLCVLSELCILCP